jgi:hypothetical protein
MIEQPSQPPPVRQPPDIIDQPPPDPQPVPPPDVPPIPPPDRPSPPGRPGTVGYRD